MKTHDNLFNQITSIENLLESWREFRRGKRSRDDVMVFERNLEDNLFALHEELKSKSYRHSQYSLFFINDPKPRRIHKAMVKDRVIHHAVYRILYPIFDRTFIFDSYSCRKEKGTHKAVERLENFTRNKSKNFTQPCFALKCDIKKFFATVDHSILLEIVRKRISDKETIWLLEEIINSFPSASQIERERERERERESNFCLRQKSLFESDRGIPIGNLTSQLFANIYLNEFDQFVKHQLKCKYYLRYTDDFVIIAEDCYELLRLLPQIKQFLSDRLKLQIHPHKISIRKLRQGIDFLGYVILPFHCRIRTKTRKRVYKKLKQRVKEYEAGLISKYTFEQSLNSYLGTMSHANTHELQNELKNKFSIC